MTGEFPSGARRRLAKQAYNVLLPKIVIGKFTEGDTLPSESAAFEVCRAALDGSPTAYVDARFVDVAAAVQQDTAQGVNLSRFFHIERSRSVMADHGRTLKAIRRNRPEDARRAMRTHLENVRLRMSDAPPATLAASA